MQSCGGTLLGLTEKERISSEQGGGLKDRPRPTHLLPTTEAKLALTEVMV